MQIWRNTDENDLEGEVWAVCVDAPRYEVSNLGRFRAIFNVDYGNGQRVWVGKIITQNPSSKTKRYLRVTLNVGGVRICFNSHRLVARAFVHGETETRNQVNHKDGNPENNTPDNLEWVTCLENKHHAISTGLQWYVKGEDRKDAKLNYEAIADILHRYFFQFEKLQSIGEDYGMQLEYMSLIVRGKRWTDQFNEFVKQNQEYYDRVAPVLKKRNGNNQHKFETRIKEALNGYNVADRSN